MRKWPAISILELYSRSNTQDWNMFLAVCLEKMDMNLLLKTRYQIQAGMDDLVKQKLNDEKIVDFYLRINRSLENTLKQIYRKKYPNPLDNPDNVKNIHGAKKEQLIKEKRARDAALEAAKRKYGY